MKTRICIGGVERERESGHHDQFFRLVEKFINAGADRKQNLDAEKTHN